MNVAPGVEVLEIPAVIMGTKTLIYPTLIWDEKTTILVDAGFPGQISDFRQAIMETGTSRKWTRSLLPIMIVIT